MKQIKFCDFDYGLYRRNFKTRKKRRVKLARDTPLSAHRSKANVIHSSWMYTFCLVVIHPRATLGMPMPKSKDDPAQTQIHC